jgi:AraC-like DNA-binding protein
VKTASRSISVAEAAGMLAKAAEPTLVAIAWDERRAPPRLRCLFAALRDKLFDPDLSLERLRTELGIGDRAIWAAFGDAVGRPAWTYVREARLETVARLLLQSSLSVEKIGLWVGYESVTTFRKLLREYLGELPTRYQRRARRLLKRAGPPPRDLDSPEYWERAVAGELSDEEARELDDYLDGLYPEGGPAPTVEDNPWTRLREELAAALADSLDQLPGLRSAASRATPPGSRTAPSSTS